MALPLYPKLKGNLEAMLMELFEAAVRHELGPFRESPRLMQHEGNNHTYSTVHGDVRATDYQDMMVEFQLNTSDLPDMDFQDVLNLVVAKGNEFGGQQATYHFGNLDKIIEESGNVVEGPMTLNAVLETLDKIHISFDDAGNPSLPTIVVHPNLIPRIREIMSDADTNDEAKARMKAIIERKRREWNEEQDRRKLVD